MSKIAMNCGYCGKKCDMKKDLCVPQDSVYVCKTCYDWSQKVADLEAKLAESEKYAEYNIPKLIEANKRMSKQLAEKEDEYQRIIEGTLNSRDKLFKEQMKQHNQDKIELLEKAKDRLKTFEHNYNGAIDCCETDIFGILDTLIKEIKGE